MATCVILRRASLFPPPDGPPSAAVSLSRNKAVPMPLRLPRSQARPARLVAGVRRHDRTARSAAAFAPPAVGAAAELLEGRALLTVFTVNTTADTVAVDGRVSFREALIAANTNSAVNEAAAGEATGDRIVFGSGIAGGRIVLDLARGSLQITDDVTVSARGAIVDAARIDGPALTVDLVGTEQVVLDSLQVRNAVNVDTGLGGGIFFAGSAANSRLGLRGVRLLNNRANDGGGLYQAGGSSVVAGGAMIGNFATAAAGSGGGAFLESGRMTVRDTLLQANEANRAGGGVEVGGLNAAASLTIDGARFLGNVAGRGAAATPGNGGGIHTTNATSLAISDALFRGNVAGNEGGGVWVNTGDRLSIVGTEFTANNARGTRLASGGTVQNEGGGGGLFNNGGVARLEDVTFRSNAASGAAGSGGGINNAVGGTILAVGVGFERNTASRAGGGIEITGGRLTGSELVFLGNVTGGSGTANPGNGGALHAAGAGETISISLTDSLFLSNRAADEGAGLWIGGGDTIRTRVAGSFFDGNRAGTGGGVFITGGQDVALVDTSLTGNAALSGDGGAVQIVDGTLRASGLTADSNTASGTGGGISNGDAGGPATLAVLADSSVTGNTAGTDGGGIFTDALSETRLRTTAVTGNTPNDLGGTGTVS